MSEASPPPVYTGMGATDPVVTGFCRSALFYIWYGDFSPSARGFRIFAKKLQRRDSVAASRGPFRQAMFVLTVRNSLANRLVDQMGYSRSEARQAARELDDAVIEEAANRVAPKKKVGAGGLLAFLLSFIQSDAFKQLIEIILSLFSGQVSEEALAAVAAMPEPGGDPE